MAGLVTYGVIIPSALAHSVFRESHEPMILNADVVVIGHEILVENVKVPPNASIHRRHFLIEEVLKGSKLKPGDIIVQEFVGPVSSHVVGDRTSKPVSPARVVACVMLKRPNTSTTRYFVYPADVEKATRLVDVASNPQNYLDSDNSSDVQMILAWIEATYCDNNLYYGRFEERHQAEATLAPEAAVAYLLGRIRHLVGAPPTRAVTPETDESLKRVLMQLRARPYNRAIKLLGFFDLPDAADGLFRELGRLIKDGETTEPNSKLHTVIKAIACQGDERAVAVLLDLLSSGPSRSNPDSPRPRRVSRRDQFCPIIMELGRLGDRSAADTICEFLYSDTTACSAEALAQLGDRRAIEPLLKHVFLSKRNVEALERFVDPRIAKVARERLHNEPDALMLLASQGDPADREFMHQLIRQGHPAGARWAAEAMDQTAHDLLVDALTHGEPFASLEILYALGRLRSFSMIKPVLNGEFRSIASTVKYPDSLLRGFLGEPIRVNNRYGCSWDGWWEQLSRRLDAVANQEQWSNEQLEFARELLNTYRTRMIDLKNPANNGFGWVPPTHLPDMPNPLFVDAAAAYLENHRDECLQLLRGGEDTERYKILKAARDVGVNFLDNKMTIDLLHSRSSSVASVMHTALRNGDISFSPEEVRQWALDGHHSSARTALAFMARKPNPDYVPIIIEVFNRGWHLYEPELYRAITANRVTQLVEPLRKYTEHQPLKLREMALTTLDRLGD